MRELIQIAVTLLVISVLSGCAAPAQPAEKSYGADLVITETADRQAVEMGGRITLTITVTNRGPNAASGIIFGSPVPVALEYISWTCSMGAESERAFCELDHLASGKSAVAQIVATPIDNPTSSELSLNSKAFIVEYIAFDPNRNNNSTSVAVTILPKTLGTTH